MKTNEIKILLQKFFEGRTSRKEELMLEDFFLAGEPHPDLEAEEKMFLELRSARDSEIPVPQDMEVLVLQRLAPLQQKTARMNRRLTYSLLSAAAAITLLVSTFIFLNRQDQSITITDPQLAYTESRQALETVSEYLNRGTAGLSGLRRLSDASKPLRTLSSLDKAAQELAALSKLGTALDNTQELATEQK